MKCIHCLGLSQQSEHRVSEHAGVCLTFPAVAFVSGLSLGTGSSAAWWSPWQGSSAPLPWCWRSPSCPTPWPLLLAPWSMWSWTTSSLRLRSGSRAFLPHLRLSVSQPRWGWGVGGCQHAELPFLQLLLFFFAPTPVCHFPRSASPPSQLCFLKLEREARGRWVGMAQATPGSGLHSLYLPTPVTQMILPIVHFSPHPLLLGFSRAER